MEESEGRGKETAVTQIPREKERDDKYILCPLYIAHTDNEIRCKPHVPDATATIIRYKNRESCASQRKLFCEGCWSRCENYITWKHWTWEDED